MTTARKTTQPTAAKKTATRPPAAARAARAKAAARANLPEPTGPVLNLDAYPQEPDPEVVHLFTLNGVDYYVPKRPSAGIAMAYLAMARTGDLSVARAWCAEQLLGPEAWSALISWPGLTFEITAQIVGLCVGLVVGNEAVLSGPLGRG